MPAFQGFDTEQHDLLLRRPCDVNRQSQSMTLSQELEQTVGDQNVIRLDAHQTVDTLVNSIRVRATIQASTLMHMLTCRYRVSWRAAR